MKLQDGEMKLPKSSLPPNRWIYPKIMGDMSIGAISWECGSNGNCNSILNEVIGIPVRMCQAKAVFGKTFKSRYLKYMILQNASGHFG
jgi:glutamate synthase (NADPH/NADH) large chain